MILISPHYDDLILSLPGQLRVWADYGEAVQAVVVFSNESEALAAACAALFAELGVEVRPLGLDDAGRRGLAGRALLNPAGWRPDQLAGAQVDAIAERLEAALAGTPTEDLLRPCLPVQIDHALTLSALGRLGRMGAPCYADQPYAFKWPMALACGTKSRRAAAGPAHHSEDARRLAALAPLTPQFDMARFIRRRIEAGTAAEPIFTAQLRGTVPPVAPSPGSVAARP